MADDDKTRWAIDVMTAWADGDCGFLRDRVDDYLAHPQGDRDLVTGLVNLNGLLLSGLEVTTGRSPTEILQAIASTITRR